MLLEECSGTDPTTVQPFVHSAQQSLQHRRGGAQEELDVARGGNKQHTGTVETFTKRNGAKQIGEKERERVTATG
jgi:hypothetical protein